MKKGKKTYRLAFLFLSLFYINFFVFVPYFHHHHTSCTNSRQISRIIVSFLPSDCCEVNCESSYNHDFAIDTEHSHKEEICKKNDITSSSDNQFNYKANKTAQIDYKIFSDNQFSNSEFFEQSIHLINWQKLVHKAANTSPPIS